METLLYIINADHENSINPDACIITEEFEDKSKLIGRVFREKVPCKQAYVIMKQKEHNFPEVLDITHNIRTASTKLLKYSLKWINELIGKEGNLNLFLDYKIVDNTHIKERKSYLKFKIP